MVSLRLLYISFFSSKYMNLESLWTLLLLSIAMGIGSMGAGYLPLTLQLAQDKLDWIATYGAGLLIGAVFMVIIPEGVETVYTSKKIATVIATEEEAEETTGFDKPIGLSLLFGFSFMLLIDQVSHSHHQHSVVPISVSELREYEYGLQHTPTPTLGLVIHAAADGIGIFE
jgi:solute carrier family 39 (zinc transporter), member 9